MRTGADGGRVAANDVNRGDDDTGHVIVLISGVDSAENASTIEAHGSVSVGDWSSGKMTIEGGGQVIAARDGYVAANLGTTGTVLVSGTDAAGNASTWPMEDNPRVGSQGDGTLTIAAGRPVLAGGAVTLQGRPAGRGAAAAADGRG